MFLKPRLVGGVIHFTGGEPFVYSDLTALCDRILTGSAAHIVFLTNGDALRKHESWLNRVDTSRLHFQISLDGTQDQHDSMRGAGAYRRAVSSAAFLTDHGCNCTFAMAVCDNNVSGMEHLIAAASDCRVKNVHYLWFFQKGNGASAVFPVVDSIYDHLTNAHRAADAAGVLIDNIEILKAQIFSLPGTRFDLSNAGWESLAIGPDGTIYPTPAMVGERAMACGNLEEGLERVWRTSPVLERVRSASLADHETYRNNPLRFLIGGGDIDHSFMRAGALVGFDPYVELYSKTALRLLAAEGAGCRDDKRMVLPARMGERLYRCDADMGESSFTHSNCVLSLPGNDGHTLVRSFYSRAAEEPNDDIFNPVCYDEHEIEHVPQESRIRSFGCGSPVLDCGLQPGETVVDLGSGTGVECFIAAKKVGASGRVIGIDMADAMLAVAERGREPVAANLGYDVVEFKKALLENLPLESGSADAVISNCVINLSPDKRRTMAEAFRVLKPGGRLYVSDIVYTDDIPLALKYNEKLRGECIGGAFREAELFCLLDDIGFTEARIEKRFFYREVKGHAFFSLTYSARKNPDAEPRHLIYRGPYAAVVTDEGSVLRRGVIVSGRLSAPRAHEGSVLLLSADGQVTNSERSAACSCCAQPEAKAESCSSDEHQADRHAAGCMVCGAELVYTDKPIARECYYCGAAHSSTAACRQGHFVCDACHARDALSVIREVCASADDRDMIGLLQKIRSHRAFPLHGPEHHALVPAVILTAYRNSGGMIPQERIDAGIERGAAVPGGSCAYSGACGAALGVGIAFSVILEASPLTAQPRQSAMAVTAAVLQKVASCKAPRCCQRECYSALREASRLSEAYLDVRLAADEPLVCAQHSRNSECIKKACPIWNNPVSESGK